MAKVKAKAKARAKPSAKSRKPAPRAKNKSKKKPAATRVAKRAATEPGRRRARTEPGTRARTEPGARARTEPGAESERALAEAEVRPPPVGPYLRSLRTCIYQVYDLALAREFYSQALGKDPYFDEPYYVGFEVDGHELGLDPDVSKRPPGGSGVIGYWRVDDINAAWQHLTTIGATSIELPHAVGLDLQVAIVADPFGNYIGLLQGA